LLTAGPIAIQFALTNFTAVPALGRSVAANASKLVGLGAMLYAIYGAGRPKGRSGIPRDSARRDGVRK
jgi:hypothetical protein